MELGDTRVAYSSLGAAGRDAAHINVCGVSLPRRKALAAVGFVALGCVVIGVIVATAASSPSKQTPAPEPLSPAADVLTSRVLSLFSRAPSPRLNVLMQSIVKHVHAFAKDVRLTEDEWIAGIEFLERTGLFTTGVRREFILLSDTLGLSSLVDIINNGEALGEDATEPTILGPFYVPDSPWRKNGDSMIEYEYDRVNGSKAIVQGRVLDASGRPIPYATLDVWQNSADGFYAVQKPELHGINNLRGRFNTSNEGEYSFHTVRPIPYKIPDDGPVGRMLEATGRHPWRTAHIHVKLSAEGYKPITTHIFDSQSLYLDSDSVFGVKDSLICTFSKPANPGDPAICDFSFTMTRA